MRKFQTLHCHTKTSDGVLTYSQVLETCSIHNISAVAFTDHDGLMEIKDFNQLKKCKPEDVSWVSGIEISSSMPKEVKDAGGSIHVIGLFVDPFNKELRHHCVKMQEARRERMQRMVGNLKGIGIDISVKDCLRISEGEAVGRPHIVEAIHEKKSNSKVISELVERMKKDSENSAQLKKNYDEMIKDGRKQYPYYLFLSHDAYMKGVYVDYLFRSEFDAGASLIRKAGGLAFLAHWFTDNDRVTEKILDKVLSEDRLDGVETVYGVWSKGSIWKNQLDKESAILKKLIRKYKKLESGGVDAHKPEDFKVFVKQEWYAKRTVGMLERIMENQKVDTKWSSLS